MSATTPSIGPYRVVRLLGHGAMSTVFEGVDGTGQRAALKVLNPELATDGELRLRFAREFETVRALEHPNIVHVRDSGESGGRLYLALEYVEGYDLDVLIGHRVALQVERKIDLIRQLCEGLASAHARGIVHRDIKPANLRVTPAGDLKIMDFGMARLRASTLTRRGQLLGSMNYVAPEQLEAEAIDERADVFSAGVVAYELLAERRPYEADNLPAYMAMLTHGDTPVPPLPSTAYSPRLDAAVLKAVERDLDRRLSSVDALRQELFAAVRDAVAASRSQSP